MAKPRKTPVVVDENNEENENETPKRGPKKIPQKVLDAYNSLGEARFAYRGTQRVQRALVAIESVGKMGTVRNTATGEFSYQYESEHVDKIHEMLTTALNAAIQKLRNRPTPAAQRKATGFISLFDFS